MGLSYFSGCFRHTSVSSTVNPNEDESGGEFVPIPKFGVFSYDELKAATQGFRYKIGEGGHGSVYKGRLQRGVYVAVKVLLVELESMRGEREFIAEIAALSDIKHENLVTLLGCCVDGAKRLLVYEYMENNCLAHAFLGREQNRMKFNWELRRDISTGIAKGISYLHEEIDPHIVHRDIKGSNILLDQNFTPKLGDFGLSKLFKDDISHISTRVAGTFGQPVVDFHLQYGEQFQVEKVWESYKDNNLLELIDPVLNEEFPKEEAIWFLKVGLLCVQENASLRPGMSSVFNMLKHEIKTESVIISQPGLVCDLMEVKIRQKQSSNFPRSQASDSTATLQARRLATG
ncbi:unnamed protein product [Fraxinus pennsylvanica]|uniref:non-specific serine/threonine protein kinase n=1 Tax=Fraxinus pennsylvanica TaxID=56036 RepID=A0AAD2DWY8_9LAMI|nr:unnamed protein product [Fraxinus pennsylvanica]